MLVNSDKLINTPILSMQTTSSIGNVPSAIINPDNFKIVAFYLSGGIIDKSANILATSSIREYSHYGIVVDSIDEVVGKDDVVKISKIIDLHFGLTGLKVETKKGSKLGKVSGFTFTSDDFTIQQIIVKRPLIKSFTDSELVIHRNEIVEVDDYKIIVKDEEKTIKQKSMNEDFVPNFVNPFRKTEQDFVPTHTKTPADKDIE